LTTDQQIALLIRGICTILRKTKIFNAAVDCARMGTGSILYLLSLSILHTQYLLRIKHLFGLDLLGVSESKRNTCAVSSLSSKSEVFSDFVH
jgi:hypothetical protein